MTPTSGSASRMGLCACEVCGLICRIRHDSGPAACPRCRHPLCLRKGDSIARCWALVIAALILYVPANLIPIMETGSLFDYRKDTIVSGVVYLWDSGSWIIAIIVFVASVVIPLLKLISLTLLLISVQRRSLWRPRQRSALYRLLELVGKWSMLDVYVVTILAALVTFQPVAVVKAGNGVIAFAAVVILTTLATNIFDPRLIWDPFHKEQAFDD